MGCGASLGQNHFTVGLVLLGEACGYEQRQSNQQDPFLIWLFRTRMPREQFEYCQVLMANRWRVFRDCLRRLSHTSSSRSYDAIIVFLKM